MRGLKWGIAAGAWLVAFAASAAVTVFESSGDLATVTATRDAFRSAIGGGTTAGPNGSFGGVRREINWDGVPDARSDPNLLPADFFNVNSPRGVVFSSPGTGFMVSGGPGLGVPIEFGFADQLQAFSPARLFTALNSTITDVHFFVPGTTDAATTTAFGVVFSDVDVAGSARVEFYDKADNLLFGRDVLPSGGDEMFSFLGGVLDSGSIGRVRITSGSSTIVSNGVLGNAGGDLVVMDDFLYAEPAAVAQIPEPPMLALFGIGLLGLAMARRRRASR
jgi:hypothetical protein